MTRRKQNLAALLVIVACIALVHGSAFLGFFDYRHGETNSFIRHTQNHIDSVADCFTESSYYPGLYRPLTTSCYYYLGLKVFGDRIEPFKVVSLFAFLGNCFLLFLVCRLFLPFLFSLLGAVLFATRGAHTHNLVFSIEFQGLLAVCFSLLMLYFFIRAARERRALFEVLSYLFFVLAMLSKEASVAFVAIVVVYGWLFDESRALRPYIICVALAALWAGLFFFVFRGAGDGLLVPFKYSYAPTDVLRNYISYVLGFSNFLLTPVTDVVMKFGGVTETIANSRVAQAVFAVIVVADAAFVIFGRRMTFEHARIVRLMAFGFAFFVLAMVPYVIFQDRLVVRYCYVGHLGIAILLAGVVSVTATAFRKRKASLLA